MPAPEPATVAAGGLALVAAIAVTATIALRDEQLRVSHLEHQLAALHAKLDDIHRAAPAEEDETRTLASPANPSPQSNASLLPHTTPTPSWLDASPVQPARILLAAVLLSVGWRVWQGVESCRAELTDFSQGGGRDGVATARLLDVITYRVEQWCAAHMRLDHHLRRTQGLCGFGRAPCPQCKLGSPRR